MPPLRQDLLYALRRLRKTPFFTLAVVATLALGIGATTALFNLVYVTLLRPLPYEAPERLVRLWGTQAEKGRQDANVSPLDLLDWQRRSTALSHLGAFGFRELDLAGQGEPQRVAGAVATSDFFAALGVRPALGRLFTPVEDRLGAGGFAILSHELWTTAFGGRTDLAALALTVDGRPATVIGVLPPGFEAPAQGRSGSPRLWVPLQIDPQKMGRGGHWLYAIGRLAPGATVLQAQTEMSAIAADLEKTYPPSNAGWGVRLEPLDASLVGATRPALLLLFGATAFVLLIVCANVANLMLARSMADRQSLGIATALGASRATIVRQLLVESGVLAALGGAAGYLLAALGSQALHRLAAGTVPRLETASFGGPALLCAVGVSVLTLVGFGLLPALRVSRGSLQATLGAGTRAAAGTEIAFTRNLLVVVQVALATVLLIGSGLLLRSLWTLTRVDPGFAADRVLTFQLNLPESRYSQKELAPFYRRVLERTAGVPGVAAVAAIDKVPLGGGQSCDGFQIVERPNEDVGCAEVRFVSQAYHRVMGIPLVAGRAFLAEDEAPGAPLPAIVNEAMARRLWPGASPLGQHLDYGAVWEIIGVAADVRDAQLDTEAVPEMYFPYARMPWSRGLDVVVRASGDPLALAPALRQAVWSLDASLPVHQLRTLHQLVDRSTAAPAFRTYLLGLFAAIALALAVLGLYAVVTYLVSLRRHELGIRLAIGADRKDILGLILRQGLSLSSLGLLLGLASALLARGLLARFLFGVTSADGLAYALPILVLGLVAFFASFFPARRATRVDPVAALRSS